MNVKTIILAAAAACGLAAQIPTCKVVASIPFAFEARGVSLPAGKYVVAPSGTTGVLKLRDVATGKSIHMQTGVWNDAKLNRSSLQFRSYDGIYFLNAVNYETTGKSVSIPVSRHEKEIAIAIVPRTIEIGVD